MSQSQILTLEEKKKIIFERINKIILQNMNSTLKDTTVKIRSYTKEDIRKFNENPALYQKQLYEISNYLYIVSSHYRRLIHHFALLPTFDYHIKVFSLNQKKSNKKMFEQTYYKVSEYLDFMNLKYEIPKIMINCIKNDVFYGYVYETSDTFFIRKLEPQYCSISSIENGLLVYQFDFSYFNNKKERLQEFGDEFVAKYALYEKNKKNNRWQELELKNTCCFKFNDDELVFNIPPFSGVFESVIELDEYKKLKLNKEKINNYKVIFEKIPLDTKTGDVDAFLISLDQALTFHGMTETAIAENVGLALTPFDITTVDFKSDTADSNKTNEAIESFWNGCGVASGLMGSDKANSGSIIQMSTKNDEAISFKLLRQIEKWINYRLLKFNASDYKFKAEFINSTIYNISDLVNQYKEMSTYGHPVLTRLNALLGMNGEEVINMNYLETEVLKLNEKFKPLLNSHVISGDKKSGRPDNGKVSDSKDKTIESDSNIDGNRVKR